MTDPKRERALTAAQNSAAAKWRRKRARRAREPSSADWSLALGSGKHCWCGRERDHDWPGKTDGVPHPRDTQEGSL